MLAEESFGSDDPRHQTVTCLACSGVHFVDPVDGGISRVSRDE